jgi:glucan phosphoethanolaminetransferase (alkaline phosphatase superfamily)
LDIVFAAACWTLVAILLFRSRWLAAAAVFILGLAWLLYSPSILTWVEHLGSDSFSEAQNFDLIEAINFLESLKPVLRRQSLRATGLTIALGFLLAAAVYAVAVFLARGRGFATAGPVAVGASVLIAGLVSIQLYPAVSAFRSNSEIYRGIYDNFHARSNATVIQSGPARDLKVVVYIGESISALNMGIYGYPRQTTPELEAFQAENENVLVFHEVFAPHVHTAPSLLEALSVGVDRAEDFMPIADRRRVSVIDLLNQAGIPSSLISNQGSSGTWNNLASTVVFRNVADKEFSFNSVLLGELEHRARRPLDHEFLVTALDEHGSLHREGREVVFMHSYAGHGPYLRHIDERYKQPVDDFLQGRSAVSIIGNGIPDPDRVVRTVEDYDSTVRYADYCVASVLRRVKASPFPAVFVYFSDHGDAVYAGRLHDSSRFLHEMARVPFHVYFNEAAARHYPDLVSRFRSASSERKPSTLAQFPASLLSLFGLEVEGGFYKGIGQDDLETLPPILTRETGAGYSYVRIGTEEFPGIGLRGPRDATDAHTGLFRATRLLRHETTQLCQYDSNTIGKALRGAMVADCLWLEVAEGQRGIPTGDPSPSAPAGLDLEAVTDIARGYGRSLWIAGRELHSAAGCRSLDSFFAANAKHGPLNALIMFPSNTPWHEPELRVCIDSLRSKGFRTAFEVPLGTAVRCSHELAGSVRHDVLCAGLSQLLRDVAESGAFTDLGFDYSAAGTIEQLAVGTHLGWNVWNVTVEQLDSNRLSRFRMVAVDLEEDPNDR